VPFPNVPRRPPAAVAGSRTPTGAERTEPERLEPEPAGQKRADADPESPPAGPETGPPTDDRRRGARGSGSEGGRHGLLWRARRVLFLVAFLLFTGLAGTAYALSRISLPPALPQQFTTTLADANDKPLAQLSSGVNRTPVTIDQVPQVVVDAVVATEDRKFFHHHGVDPVGVTRAFIADVMGRGSLQGGSTLTQQYIKNAYLGQQRTFSRKVKEAMLALKVERQLTKRQILERYLNTIYFGRGAYGIQAASGAYFGKDVSQLDLNEAAFLAGAIRAPEYADPQRDPVTAKARRDRTLQDLAATHKITAAQAAAVQAVPIGALPFVPADQKVLADPADHAEYFVDYVTQLLIRAYGEKVVYGGGLRVKTSLDLNMQRQAYDAVYNQVLKSTAGPAGALISLDNSGAVKAMVGGRDYTTSKVNLAVGQGGGGTGRQPGSTMKGVLLAELVRENYSVLSSFRAPAQVTIPKADAGKDWTVSNFNNEDFSGPDGTGTLNMIDATKDSVNTVYAQAVMAIGPKNMAQMGDALGLGPRLPANPSLVLGTSDESVLQMAGAYSVFADNGSYMEPHTILGVKDSNGSTYPLQLQNKASVLTPGETDIISHCLRQVVLGGTGTLAGFGHPVAGKTGTTSSNTDAWFVGYTAPGGPQLTTAVWIGYPNKAIPMVNVYGVKAVTGGTLPADIFRRFMSAALPPQIVQFHEPSTFPGKALGQVPAVFPTTTTSSTSSTTSTTTPAPSTTVTTAPPRPPTAPAPPPTAPPTAPPTSSPPTTAKGPVPP